VNPPLPLLSLLLLLASPAQATPERAAQQQASQQQAAQPAPAGMGGANGQFPPAMMQAIAEREAMMAGQAEPSAVPEPTAEPTATTPAPTTEASEETEPLPQLAEAPAGSPLSDQAEIDRRAQTIAEGLRCPVCQGLSAGDSQAESAIAMRTRAGDLVAAGYSDEQINAYFVERYGEWVLLEPPRSGRHWLIWLGPLAFLGLGLLVVAWRMTSESQPTKGTITNDDAEEDPYEKRILDELERS
jgi:cytochrome c-type biogenesis protein CcmH